MIGIRFLLLFLNAIGVLSYQLPINGEIYIQPEQYTWIAHLEYVGEYNNQCLGSVISDRHVLTYSHCVTTGLTGVRLGDFAIGPHCRYDGFNCAYYKHFGLEKCVTPTTIMPNNLALLCLNDTTLSGLNTMRVRLPIRMPQLIDLGYLLILNLNELTAKQFVIIPLLNKIECEIENSDMMCTGIFAANAGHSHSVGMPILHQFNRKRIVTNGIRPIIQGFTHYPDLSTKLYIYIKNETPIPKKNSTTEISTRFLEHELPKDCGYSPIYPRELIGGGYKIEPDEFSWVASLVYGTTENKLFGNCSGSVITSRYVLTAARCIFHSQLGQVIGIRLGNFERQPFCDYGTEGCGNYQYFPIENFKALENHIALLQLKRDIVFDEKMKPICLPFGTHKDIAEPELDSFLTVAGWWTTTFPRDVIAKRSEAVAFWNTTGCMEADRDKNTQICGVKPGESPCTTEFGSPLMNMFERRRMVLEGIAYDGVTGCPGRDVGTLYTNVRKYGSWILNSISLLETRGTSGKNSTVWK